MFCLRVFHGHTAVVVRRRRRAPDTCRRDIRDPRSIHDRHSHDAHSPDGSSVVVPLDLEEAERRSDSTCRRGRLGPSHCRTGADGYNRDIGSAGPAVRPCSLGPPASSVGARALDWRCYEHQDPLGEAHPTADRCSRIARAYYYVCSVQRPLNSAFTRHSRATTGTVADPTGSATGKQPNKIKRRARAAKTDS